MNIICKLHHNWTRNYVAAQFGFLAFSHSCCSVLSRMFVSCRLLPFQTPSVLIFKKWPQAAPTHVTSRQVRSVQRHRCPQWGHLRLKCCHSFTGRKKSLQSLAMHLTETSASLRWLVELTLERRKIMTFKHKPVGEFSLVTFTASNLILGGKTNPFFPLTKNFIPNLRCLVYIFSAVKVAALLFNNNNLVNQGFF